MVLSFVPAILFFLFLAVVMILLRVVVAAIRFKRRVKRTMDGIFNRGEGGGERAERQTAEKRRKVYPKNVGEYVAFEEIAVDESAAASDDADEHRQQSFVEESQITDVEFEEISEKR